MKGHPQIQGQQAGALLLEVLIAILIFSLGITGLIAATSAAARNVAVSEDRNHAALWANELASQMWAIGSVGVSSAYLTAWKAGIAGTSSSSSASILATGLGPLPSGLGSVATVSSSSFATITITWQAPSASSVSTYSTEVQLPQ